MSKQAKPSNVATLLKGAKLAFYHRYYSTLSQLQENMSKQAKPRNVATLLNRAKLGDIPTNRRLSAIMFYLHFWNFLGAIYRWNRNEVFYLLSSSDVAYLDCVGIYKAFNFAASPKIEC